MFVIFLILIFGILTYGKETGDFVKGYGYPFEAHKVTTEDGYILELHRIPHGKNSISNNVFPGKPVLIQHGILCSSMDFSFTEPNNNLAYLLADQGYDVWLGNFRGNKYSDNHIFLSKKDKKFWDFTWHEMGQYDLPVMINKILSTTSQNKIYYIGHSQGTTAFFVMLSLKPEYNTKVRLMAALSPVAYMSHVKSPLIRPLANPLYIFGKTVLGNMFGYSEFRPNDSLQVRLTNQICNLNKMTQNMCLNVIFLLVGSNWPNFNTSLIPMLNGHSSGVSTKQVLHFVQEINSGKFRQFDYGMSMNKKRYENIAPPEYNLGKTTVPVALYYSVNDYLCSEKDVEITASFLPNVVQKYLIPDKKFNHIDYMWGLNAKKVLYDNVLDILRKY